LPETVAKDAFEEVCGKNAKKYTSFGQYDHVLEYTNKQGQKAIADKVKFARAAVKRPADLTVLDLRKQIGKLIEFIRRASIHRQRRSP